MTTESRGSSAEFAIEAGIGQGPAPPPPSGRSLAETQPEAELPGLLGRGLVADRARVQRLMLVRVVVVTALFGVVTLLRPLEGPGVGPTRALYPVIVGAYALSLLYGLAFRRLQNLRRFTYVQFVLDALCIALLTLATGGAESSFSILYVFNILGAGILLFARGGLVVATVDTVFYLATVVAELTGLFTPVGAGSVGALLGSPVASVEGYSRVALHIVSFYLLAFLAGSLAQTQADTGRALAATEHSLLRLRDMHGRILQNIDVGIITIDRKSAVTSFNRAAEDILRHRAQAVLGQGLDDVLSGLSGVVSSVTDPSASLPPGGIRERWATRRDGKRVYLRIAASPLRTAEGVIDGLILVFEDRTKLLMMEEQLQRDERLAAVGRLAAGIAHEIRNPLASIRGSVQVLRQGPSVSSDDDELLGIVEREAERLGHLVSDFLTMAREEKPNFSLGRVSPLVRETLSLLQSRGITQQVRVEQDLHYDPTFRFDDARLRQVLWNLVNNAVQSMPSGGTLRVTTARVTAEDLGELQEREPGWMSAPEGARRPGEGAVRLDVRDTGAGIPDEALSRVFDPFYTTRSGGTGLGLAIVRRIVQGHGGVVTVESALGRGTCFSLWLPAAAEDSSGSMPKVG